MIGVVRAAAAATAMMLASWRKPARGPSLAVAVRRLGPSAAALTLAPADLQANALSLWAREWGGQCRVRPIYGPALVSARILAVARFDTARPAPPEDIRAPGVAALWDRLRAAGFVMADEAALSRIHAAPAADVRSVVRVLKEVPRRPRRADRSIGEARIAA